MSDDKEFRIRHDFLIAVSKWKYEISEWDSGNLKSLTHIFEARSAELIAEDILNHRQK